MSVTYEARTIVGIRLPYEKVWKTIKVKIGDHDFLENVLFHPKTGERLWENYYINCFSGDGELPDEMLIKTENYSVHVIEENSYSDKPGVLVGAYLNNGDDGDYADEAKTSIIPNVEQLKKEIKEVVGDLWEDQEIRIFCVLCSIW